MKNEITQYKTEDLKQIIKLRKLQEAVSKFKIKCDDDARRLKFLVSEIQVAIKNYETGKGK